MLTTEQIRVLNDARTILKNIKTGNSTYSEGRAAEACDRAQGAIFEALNVINAYLHIPISEDLLHNREENPTRSLGSAYSVTLDSDEDGFELRIDTDDGRYVVNVQGVTDQIIAAGEEVSGWLEEGRRAAAEHRVFACDPDESLGYATDDPKHESWHSRHADLWDTRSEK